MSKKPAFWDSSALVPLCVRQPQSDTAKALFESYQMTVWWAAPVEIQSALTRALRLGEIGSAQFLAGKGYADDLAQSWTLTLASMAISVSACSLLEAHPLRAADALQLAAALASCNGAPQGEIFICFDERLRQAAGSVGFTVR